MPHACIKFNVKFNEEASSRELIELLY